MFQLIPVQANLFCPQISSSVIPRFGFSSSASPETSSDDATKTSEKAKVDDQNEENKGEDQTSESG
jgi:hypothetical protein